MGAAPTKAERRAINRRAAAEARVQAATGDPRATAHAWWQHALGIAVEKSKQGDDTALYDLARTLQHWSDRYGQ